MKKHTITHVEYTKNGVTYSHTFSMVLARPQVEQRMLMMYHIPAHNIGQVTYA